MAAADAAAVQASTPSSSKSSKRQWGGRARARAVPEESAPEPSGNGQGSRTSTKEMAKRPFRPYHSINVPRRSDLETEFLSRNDMVTTIMLRNIPNRYSQSCLIEEINGVGFSGRFDFFYLPMDVHNRTNVGYAFINFLTPLDAQQFFKVFKGYMFKRHCSKKIAGASPAHVQGLRANLEHFSHRVVTQSRDTEYRPAVFLNGQRYELTEALQELRQQAACAPLQAAVPKGRQSLSWEQPGPVANRRQPGLQVADASSASAVPAPTARSAAAAPARSQVVAASSASAAPAPAARSAAAAPARSQAPGWMARPASEQHPMTPNYTPITAEQHMTAAWMAATQVPTTKLAACSHQQMPVTSEPKLWQDEGFMDARTNFESAIAALLISQPSDPMRLPVPPSSDPMRLPVPPSQPVAPMQRLHLSAPPGLCDEAKWDNSFAGSRTGTPRSTTSSADCRRFADETAEEEAGYPRAKGACAKAAALGLMPGEAEPDSLTPRTDKCLLGITLSL